MQSKTFRLFISSTFKDFRQERELLQVKVFPRIKEYCAQRGYAFQPIDLRWGVSEEAQLDQKTLELCLNEVRACKTYVHPNFLIMIGDRYGWIPLPYAIEKEEFETLLALASTEQEKELLVEWYELDLNQLPASYILKERSDKYKESNTWSEVEKSLLIILQTAVKASSLNQEQKRKYFLSATEAEVEEGIIPYIKPTKFQKEELLAKNATLEKVDPQYIFGFFRDIDKTTQIEHEFLEDDYEEAQEFKKRVANVLDAKNRLHVQTTQRNKESLEEEYLKEFEAFIIKKLTDAIDNQIKEKADISPLEQERLEQQQFKKLKIDTFFGRENELEIMQNYIKEIGTQPFMIHGISGIGKSSFLAKFIDILERTLNQPLVYRFIGATASSSNVRQLLESIIIDLAEKKILSLPNKFEVDSNKFDEQIKKLLESISEPTIIIIDALDQLQDKDFLQWLPIQLPENLKIILSVLDEQDTQHYYALLKGKLATNNQLKLEPIHENVAIKILDKLFHKEERCLTNEQRAYLLKQFTKSKSSPLYLILAFQEAKTWKSTENNISLAIGIQNIIKQFIDNLTKKFHHDKLIVHKVLGLIAASKDGLSETEIMDLLSRDESILSKLETHNSLGDKAIRRFPSSVWVRLSNHLKPFLSERFIDGQNLITFFHKQVTLAVKNYIYEPNKIAFHTELADYFIFLSDKSNITDVKFNKYSYRVLEEYPYQLSKINSLKTNELLQNPIFILAKIINGKYYTLLNNYIYFNNKLDLSIKILKMLQSTYFYYEHIQNFACKFYLQQLCLLDKKYITELEKLEDSQNLLINHSDNFSNPLLAYSLSGHHDVIKCRAIKEDILVTGDFKGNIIVWNLSKFSKYVLRVFDEEISQIIIPKDKKIIIVRSFFKIKILELYSWAEICFFEYRLLNTIHYFHDNIYLIFDEKIVKLDLDENKETDMLVLEKKHKVLEKSVNNLIFVEYQNYDTKSYECKIYDLNNHEYLELKLSNILYYNETYLYTLSAEDKKNILVYDYDGKIIDKIKIPDVYYKLQVDSQIYFISDKFIVFKIYENRLFFIDLKNGNSCDEIMHEHIISEALINDKYIITLGYDSIIKFWDIAMLLKYKYDPYAENNNKIYNEYISNDIQSVKLTPTIASNYCLVEYESNENLEKIIFNVETGMYIMNPYNYDSRITAINYENKKFNKMDIVLDQQFPHSIQILAIEQDKQTVENPFFSDSLMLFPNNNGVVIDMDSYVVKFRKLNEKIFHEYEDNGIRKTAIALTYDGTTLIIANENGFISIYDTNITKLINALYIGSSVSAFTVSKNYLLFFSEGMIKSIQFTA